LDINNINKPTNRGISAFCDFEVKRIGIPNRIRNKPMNLEDWVIIFIIREFVRDSKSTIGLSKRQIYLSF